MTPIARDAAPREALAIIAPLFAYPDARFEAHGRAESRELRDPDVDRFLDEVHAIDPAELQMLYTATFDLAPVCSPYLGVHLFGDEGRERARLMIGLRTAYGDRGDGGAGELPDHVAEVLRFARVFGDDEWSELVGLVMIPALTRMHTLLPASNPYRHLVAAALRFCGNAASVGTREAAHPAKRDGMTGDAVQASLDYAIAQESRYGGES
jgi:nitrate reductase delta subunit